MRNVNLVKSFLLVTGFSSIFLTYFTIKQYLKRKKYGHIPGPKTKGILEFYFGNFNDILKCLDEGKILSDLYLEWSEKYGSCFKFQFFGEMVVVTNEPEAIKDIILTRNFPKYNNLYKKIGFPYKQRFMGYGLVTDTDDERWRKRRAIFNPGFHRTVLLDCLKEFNLKTNLLIEKLRLKADGKTVINFYNEINRLTLDIIGSIAFGLNIDTISHPENEFSFNIAKSFEAVNRVLTDPLFIYNPLNRNKIKDYKATIMYLRNFAKDKILARFKEMENNEYVPNDILTTIINSCKHDELDLESLIDDFITFFNAGQETTANTLAFTFLELGKNPHVLEKLRNEVESVLGSRSEVKFEDINELEYTGCVFKETLRIWPPAPDVFRISTCNFKIKNYDIPNNTQLIISPYYCGRNKKYFGSDPMEFKPERFLKDPVTNDVSVSNFTYFPFSLGPRNCIGQNFAIIESKVLIAKLVQNFDFTLVPNQSFGAVLSTTLRPKSGTLCYLRPRHN